MGYERFVLGNRPLRDSALYLSVRGGPIEELISFVRRSGDRYGLALLDMRAATGDRTHRLISRNDSDIVVIDYLVCLKERIQNGVLGHDEGIRVLGHAVGPAKEMIATLRRSDSGMRRSFSHVSVAVGRTGIVIIGLHPNNIFGDFRLHLNDIVILERTGFDGSINDTAIGTIYNRFLSPCVEPAVVDPHIVTFDSGLRRMTALVVVA